MEEYYIIGTRLDWDSMENSLNRSVKRINQSAAKFLRQGAIDNGIKATQQKIRLEFYVVTKDELDLLKTETNETFLVLQGKKQVRPLIEIEESKVSDVFRDITSQYASGGKEYDKQYDKDLRSALAPLMVKIGEDKKIQKPKFKNPYKVGEWYKFYYSHQYHNVKVTRVTDKTVFFRTIHLPVYADEIEDWKSIQYNGVELDKSSEYFTIPYKGNEDKIEFSDEEYSHRIKQKDVDEIKDNKLNDPNKVVFRKYAAPYIEYHGGRFFDHHPIPIDPIDTHQSIMLNDWYDYQYEWSLAS